MKTQALSALASELVRAGLGDTAAHAAKLRNKFNGSGDEPVTQGGGPSPSPIAAAVGGDPVREWNEKDGGSLATPASFTGGQTIGRPAIQSRTTYEPRMRPALPDASRSIVTVSNTTPHRESARSAVIIDLVVWREVHCPPAQAARSGSARATKSKMAQMTQSF